MSILVDAFLGSGVPFSGDPTTSVQNVPLLGLRTTTVLSNCKPTVQDIVKVRLIATNCGEKPIEIIPHCQAPKPQGWELSADNVVTLRPGEELDYSIFRLWETPGKHQLTIPYKARCGGRPFARLAYPTVTIHVEHPGENSPMHWIWSARATRWLNKTQDG